MKKLAIAAVAAVGSLVFAVPSFAGWDLAKSKDGVKVYTKSVPGQALKAFKGETTIKAEIQDVAYLFNTVSAYKNWTDGTIESRLVKKNSDTDQYVYLVQKAPMVSNRDVVVRGVVTQNPSTKVLTVKMKNANGMVKENPKYVRMPKLDGKFTFTPVGGGNLKVVYEVSVDAGGNIPAAAANIVAVKTPLNTLLNLKKMAPTLSKYRDPSVKMVFVNAK